MRGFQAALTAFWNGFSYAGKPIKAYLAGHVPSQTPFPYITYDVTQGDAFGWTLLTAYVWCKDPMQGNTQRADILDLIAQALPSEGRKITFNGGFAMLYRNTANFQSLYDDPEDSSVLGGRTSYEVSFYAK